MDEVIKAEIERLHDEDRRQNKRLEMLEGLVREIQSLALSVHGLAKDMEQMLHEQRDQGRRLDALEREPADAWKNAKKTFITAILSTIAGGMATGLIFIISQSIQ